MKSNPFLFPLFLFFSLSYAKEDICSLYKKCEELGKEITSQDICFKSQETSESYLHDLASSRNCGHLNDQHVVSNSTEFKEVFRDYARRCITINELVLNGHGVSGGMIVAGGIYGVDGIDEYFKGLSCAFTQKSFINLTGCLVGKGCHGARYMRRIAKVALQNGGMVRGAKAPTTTAFPGLAPHASLTGSYRTIIHQPFSTKKIYYYNDKINRNVFSDLFELISTLDSAEDPVNNECSPWYEGIIRDLYQLRALRKDNGLDFICTDNDLQIAETQINILVQSLKDNSLSADRKYNLLAANDNYVTDILRETEHLKNCIDVELFRRHRERAGKSPIFLESEHLLIPPSGK